MALALRAPLATTVLGLIAFGVLHNVLEIRYVAGRFAGLLTGRFLRLLLVLTTGIALCRLAAGAWPQAARSAAPPPAAMAFATAETKSRLLNNMADLPVLIP